MILQVASENVPHAPEVLGVIRGIGEASWRRTGEQTGEARALVGSASLQGGIVSHAKQAVLFQLVETEGEPQADMVLAAVVGIREATRLLADKRQLGGGCGREGRR